MKYRCISLLLVCAAAITTWAQAPTGWTCFAGTDGDIYRCSMGGAPEKIYNGNDATHARWSYDGRLIFFITTTGEIWVMSNTGDSPRKLATGKSATGCPLAAWRPESQAVMSVENGSCYVVGTDGTKRLVYQTTAVTFYGETSVSTDGLRMAVRTTANGNCKIEIDPDTPQGGAPQNYSENGSASISPDGQWLLFNEHDHLHMSVYHWSDAARNRTITNRLSATTWDNQTFSVNSSEWICVLFDTKGTNKGDKIGVVNLDDDTRIYKVCDISGTLTMYPDFFVGTLPDDTNNRAGAPRLVSQSPPPVPCYFNLTADFQSRTAGLAGAQIFDARGSELCVLDQEGTVPRFLPPGLYFIRTSGSSR